MRILIAEDDFTSRLFMEKFLEKYGICDLAMNGLEVIDKVVKKLEENDYYDLICLDIMMPKVDGLKALKMIRDLEKQHKVEKTAKVIMTTALNDKETVDEAYANGCDAYAWKPIDAEEFHEVIKELELL